MIDHDLGFVLRRFLPGKQKVSVLSKSRGKINLGIISLQSCQKLWPGSLISYKIPSLHDSKVYQRNAMRMSSSYAIDERIDILYVPSELTGHKIYWIHHLLEVCYYFFPLEEQCIEVFELLMYALQCTVNLDDYEYEIFLQKFCMIKLLSYAGFMPPIQFQMFLQLFEELCSKAVDEVRLSKIELVKIFLKNNKELYDLVDVWILKVLKRHPNFNFFKAFKFVSNA